MDPQRSDSYPGSPEEQAICVQCGVCCNGSLFDFALVTEEEAHSFADMFAIERNSMGPHFTLPCPHLRDCRCTVYERRPAICGRYRCKTLHELTTGSIEREEAIRRIAAIRQAQQDLQPHLLPGESMNEARARRHALSQKGGAVEPKDAVFMLKAYALELLFDRYLRSEKRQLIRFDASKEAAMQASD